MGTVRVPFALPGEEVRVGHLRRRGGQWQGRLEAVLVPSPERRLPPCPLYAQCGGCALMALSPEAQREHKRGRVAQAVARASEDAATRMDVPMVAVPDAPDLGYRRRARMAFRWTAGGVIVGYRAHRSHRLVDVASCLVLAAPLDEALTRLRSTLTPHLRGRGEIRIHLGADGRAAMVLHSAEPQPPAVYGAAGELVDQGLLAGAALWAGGATAAAEWGDPREHLVGWDEMPLVGPPEGFAQANDAVSRAIAGRVRKLAAPRDARVLELYAGHGNLTVALAPGARTLTAVERDARAAAACRENLSLRGLQGRVLAAEAAGAPGEGGADVVVLDPPREGAAEALPVVTALSPRRIVYVSCEPATLGRDLQALAAHGYAVDHAAAFDMFPHTAHVEAVVRLHG